MTTVLIVVMASHTYTCVNTDLEYVNYASIKLFKSWVLRVTEYTYLCDGHEVVTHVDPMA